MSSPQDKVVTVKLRFVSDDADARRSMRQQGDDARRLASQVRDTYRLKDEYAGRGDVYGFAPGHAPPSAVDRLNEVRAGRRADRAAAQERAQADQRARVLGSLYAQRQQELARQEAEAARQKLYDHPLKARLAGESLHEQRLAEVMGRRAEQSRFERYMADRGLTPSGDRLPVERGMIGRGLEAVGGRLGLPAGAAARFGGYAALAAPAVVGKMALDQYTQARRIDATPFLSPLHAEEAKLRGLPLGVGRAYGYAADTMAALNGDLDARRASAEARVIGGERIRLTGQAELRQDAYQAEVGQLRNRAEAMRSLSLDRRAGFDQTTVRGQQQYDLESKQLPARRALTVAARERAAAEKSLADAVGKQAEREGELADARKEYDKADRAYQRSKGRPTDVDDRRRKVAAAGGAIAADYATGGVGRVVGGLAGRFLSGAADRADQLTRYDARATDADNAKKALDAAQERANQARGNTDANQRALAEANSKVRKAEIGLTQVDLADARERVGESAAGAHQLGGMGRGGRAEAKLALRLVMTRGVGNVSPETVALAESVAPETVGKLKEEEGRKHQEEFRQFAPDEKRFADLGQAREKVKGLEEKEARQEEEDMKQSAQDAVAGVQESAKVLVDFVKAVDVALQSVRREVERAAGNAAVNH